MILNILKLIQADGGTLRKVAGTHGGEFAGACPWCSGKDRFRVWPEQDGGRYWCRGCDKAGDSIQYLREKRGLSFVQACAILGRDPGPRTPGARPTPTAWMPREAKAPPDVWQERARSFLDGAIGCLWSARGDKARAWLHAEKGLSDTTIKAASLGLNLADKYEPRGTWGLAPSLKADGAERLQWIPAGLVIPNMLGEAVHRLRIRRAWPKAGNQRYVIVSGSSAAPMILNPERAAVVVVESELDAILLDQEAGDLAGVVAMGSAQAKPDTRTHELLTQAQITLVSLDTDDAGARAAWAFWPATYGKRAKRWPTIWGKDASDARLHGLDLRAWITTGIFGSEDRFERWCIQTVDGNMTDGEAMEAMAR
jgi:DNA primase